MRGIRVTLAALASCAVLAGCGSETHENDPRPPVPTVVSIAVSEDEISAKPAEGSAVGTPGPRQPYLNQNANAPQTPADPEAPAVVNVAITNLTGRPTELVMDGPEHRVVPLTPGGSGSFNMALPHGIYRFSSPASTDTTRLIVGRKRVSSSGDLLLP